MASRLLTKLATMAFIVAAPLATGTGQVTTGATPVPSVRWPTPAHAAGVVDGDSAQGTLDRAITMTFNNVRLGDALDQIAARAHVAIVYTDRVVPVDKRVTARFAAVPLVRAVETLVAGTGVVVRRTGDRIALVREERAAAADAATGIVWGRVTDSSASTPIAGATVLMAGVGQQATTSNDSGYYFFQHVTPGVHPLQARMIGYRPEERVVLAADSQVVRVDFALRARLERLSEVLVTATGQQRRMDVGNDIVTINVDSVMAAAPVRSVTELLETRVPGLEVQHTSGAPGDPSRLRLRGISSINRQNDPILVIDGIRMDISESGNVNLATGTGTGTSQYRAPSRLDQLDPNAIETIEVFKGPSAASLYGPDAANGVIVVTTKRGHQGPTHWQATATQGVSNLRGSFPVGLFRWGHFISGGPPILCPRAQYNCQEDSLVTFQALNDARYAPFGQGSESAASMSVSGGSQALSYDFTGSYDQNLGVLRLPAVEVQRYEKFQGGTPPAWMQHPDRLTTWSGTSRLTAQLSPVATADFVSTLTSSEQQRSSLENAIGQLQGAWIDRSQLDAQGLVQGFFERATARSLTFTNVAALSWTPKPWLSETANVGLNVINRDDQTLLPAGLAESGLDTAGHFGRGSSRDVTTSANIGATAFAPLPHGMRLTTSFGMNLAANQTNVEQADTYGIVHDQEPQVFHFNSSQHTASQTTIGWYVAPTLAISPRLHLSPGFRIDGGSSSGSRARFSSLPKVDVSWVASDESFFPFHRQINTLRLRAAYGQAGVQPGLTDRLRTYEQYFGANPDGTLDPESRLRLASLGNSTLRPERSVEFEGGFDLGMFDDRLSVSYTGYDKVRRDAILSVLVAPSVAGFRTFFTNIGVVQNTGAEVALSVEPVRARLATLRVGVNFSQNANQLLRLAPGQRPFSFNDGSRIVPGYPLFGIWAKPVLGFADGNHDGIIDSSEVVVGDSAVYVGHAQPKYHASFPLSGSLLGGRVTVNATFDYQHGLTQFNQAAMNGAGSYGGSPFEHAANDPAAPLSEQAAIAALSRTAYGVIQTVNVLRFNSLSVSTALSPRAAHFFGAASMSIALQGSNLGLHTNYRGIDPGVNAFGSGEGIADTGLLPAPRTWSFSVRLGN